MGECLCLQCAEALKHRPLSSLLIPLGEGNVICNSAVHLHKTQARCQINLMSEAKPRSTSTRPNHCSSYLTGLTCRVHISRAPSHALHFWWLLQNMFPSATALCFSSAPIISAEPRELGDPAGSFGPRPLFYAPGFIGWQFILPLCAT